LSGFCAPVDGTSGGFVATQWPIKAMIALMQNNEIPPTNIVMSENTSSTSQNRRVALANGNTTNQKPADHKR
jgi:hypothetical protein